MKIQNVHDKFFKEMFGRIEIVEDFLNNYLPKDLVDLIDVNTLEPQKDSFVNKELTESFSDLLFKVDINRKSGYIYFLFEHKSFPSKDIAFQLLKYMVAIWDSKVKKEGASPLPIIIPLVVYHGDAGWNIKSSLGEMLWGYEDLPAGINLYVPDYKYLLYDFSNYKDEDIKGQVINKIIILMMRDILKKDLSDVIKSFLRYLLATRTDFTREDYKNVVKQVKTAYPEGGEAAMTLIEVFKEEGMVEGMAKGREEGREAEKAEVAKNALKKGMDKDLIADLTGLPREKIEKIARDNGK